MQTRPPQATAWRRDFAYRQGKEKEVKQMEETVRAVRDWVKRCIKSDNQTIKRDTTRGLYVPALSRVFRAEIEVNSSSEATLGLALYRNGADVPEESMLQAGDLFFCDVVYQNTAVACRPTVFRVEHPGEKASGISPDAWSNVSNGTYKFVKDGDKWTSNNNGVNSSTASSEWKADIEESGILTIKYKVSSEASYDKFTLMVDGVTVVNAISGTDKEEQIYKKLLEAGTHIVKATYTKDSSTHKGDDCGYVIFMDCGEETIQVKETGKLYTVNSVKGNSNPTSNEVPYLTASEKHPFTILRYMGDGIFYDLINGYTSYTSSYSSSGSTALFSGAGAYKMYDDIVTRLGNIERNDLYNHAYKYFELAAGQAIEIALTYPGGSAQNSSQFLLCIRAVNANTGAFYGSTARLLTLPSLNFTSNPDGAASGNVNVLSLGATANAGYSITAGVEKVTIKASSGYKIKGRIFTVLYGD